LSLIPAAAAVLWRRDDPPRVYLARRVERMRFMGNVYAFAGGRVDEVDRRVSPDGEPGALRSAVVREMIEELAVDLRTGGSADADLRREICADPAIWENACGPLDDLGDPCLRLVTPDFYPRRFDTHFFVREVDQGCEPDLLAAELDAGGWDTPAAWLDRWRAGEFLLAPPTVIMLRAIAGTDPPRWERALRAVQHEVDEPARYQELRLDPGIRLIPLRTPTLPPALHTNCYLVGTRSAWLIDPASPWPAEQELLLATLEAADVQLAGVLLTHHHNDHIAAATRVSQHFGIPVAAHPETARLLDGRVAVQDQLEAGQELGFIHEDGQPGVLRVHFTPGHALGHACFLEQRYRGLVAGDMVSTLSSILIDPADGNMADYMDSLRRLAGLDIRTVYPAHGPADTRRTKCIDGQIAHRERRVNDLLQALADGEQDLEALTGLVWGDVPRPMLAFARKSAQSILAMLQRQGSVHFDGQRARLV